MLGFLDVRPQEAVRIIFVLTPVATLPTVAEKVSAEFVGFSPH
jgi:hypothetical protein